MAGSKSRAKTGPKELVLTRKEVFDLPTVTIKLTKEGLLPRKAKDAIWEVTWQLEYGDPFLVVLEYENNAASRMAWVVSDRGEEYHLYDYPESAPGGLLRVCKLHAPYLDRSLALAVQARAARHMILNRTVVPCNYGAW